MATLARQNSLFPAWRKAVFVDEIGDVSFGRLSAESNEMAAQSKLGWTAQPLVRPSKVRAWQRSLGQVFSLAAMTLLVTEPSQSL